MPEQRTCPGCGDLYWWPKGSWQHEGCAINGAINEAINTPVGVEEQMAPVGPVSAQAKTPNRRSREAYNAYMRDYMKRRRNGNVG